MSVVNQKAARICPQKNGQGAKSMKKKLVLFSLLIFVYLFGVMSGLFLVMHHARKKGMMFPPPDGIVRRMVEKHMLNKFADRLNLTAEQKQRATEIFSNNLAQVDKYRNEFWVKLSNAMNTMNESVRLVLTEDQKKIFDEMLKEGLRFPMGKPNGWPGKSTELVNEDKK